MKILVAVDGSRYAEKGLEQAIKLAKADSGELVVLSVAALVGQTDEMPPGMRDKLVEEAKGMTAKGVEEAVKAGVKATGKVIQDATPAAGIVDYAEKIGADLVVIGAKGKSNLERFLTGSVAQTVTAHAGCSVLVIK
jgi:nucleotide-binding universal stress UspA family protein